MSRKIDRIKTLGAMAMLFAVQVVWATGGGTAMAEAEGIATSPPEIIQGSLLQTNEYEEVKLECISRGGIPAGDITWLDGNGHAIKSGVVETIKERLDDCTRFETRSILRFQASREHHNKTVTCQAYNIPAKEAMSTSIRLEVKYVSVEIPSRWYSNLFIILPCVIGGVVVIATLVLITLLYQRKKKSTVLMGIDDVEKQTKQSYKSLNDSDSKAETGTGSFDFVFNIHNEQQGSSALKNEPVCQRADCVDSAFSSKHDGHVTFADYSRRLKLPPPTRKSICNGQGPGLHSHTQFLNNGVNSRYSATSFQQFTTANNSLPLPHSGNNTPSDSTNPYGMGNAMLRTPSNPLTRDIVPSQPQLKSRRLETPV